MEKIDKVIQNVGIKLDFIEKFNNIIISDDKRNYIENQIKTLNEWNLTEKDEFPEFNDTFINQDGIPCIVIDHNKYKNLLTNSTHVLNSTNLKAWKITSPFH